MPKSFWCKIGSHDYRRVKIVPCKTNAKYGFSKPVKVSAEMHFERCERCGEMRALCVVAGFGSQAMDLGMSARALIRDLPEHSIDPFLAECSRM